MPGGKGGQGGSCTGGVRGGLAGTPHDGNSIEVLVQGKDKVSAINSKVLASHVPSYSHFLLKGKPMLEV